MLKYDNDINQDEIKSIDSRSQTIEEMNIFKKLLKNLGDKDHVYLRMVGNMILPEGSEREKKQVGQHRANFVLGNTTEEMFVNFLEQYSDRNERIKDYLKQFKKVNEEEYNETEYSDFGIKSLMLLKKNPTVIERALASTSGILRYKNSDDFSITEHESRWKGAFNANSRKLEDVLKQGNKNIINEILMSNSNEFTKKQNLENDENKIINKDDMFLEKCFLSMEIALNTKIDILNNPLSNRESKETQKKRNNQIVGMSNDFIRCIGNNEVSEKALEIGKERINLLKKDSKQKNNFSI